MNSKHLEARIEILTDGSDKTGGAAVFLTIRRWCSNHTECPDNDGDTSTSQPSDGCDHFYYQESPQDFDDGTIVARYNLSGIPSLTGRLSSDQSYKLLQNGAFNAVLVPSLVQSLHSDGGTMRGECIGGLPALFLNLIQAGYKIAGGDANSNNNNNIASTAYSSDSSVDCEKIAYTDTRYNDVSIIGPAGLNDTIEGLLDTMFGHARRRPSLRLCEVPRDEQWYQVYEDSYVCIWAHPVLHHTPKSTCSCGTSFSDSKESESGASDFEEYSLAFVITLRSQEGPNNKECQHDTKRQKTTPRPDHFRPYSFGIIIEPNPSLHREGVCKKCGLKEGKGNFQMWDVFRSLPQEIASNRNQSSFLLDFILHLNPSIDEELHHEKNLMDDNEGDHSARVERRKINVPSWMVDAKLAQDYLALFPSDTPDNNDKGLLIRAWHRSKVLHNALPFAFPSSIQSAVEQDHQNPDKTVENLSGLSTIDALKLSSCTSVTLDGWGSLHCHDRFTFLSRSNSIKSRCHERIITNWDEISHGDSALSSQCKGEYKKIIESLQCAFSGGACYCNGCDGMQQQRPLDDNEIDLDDSSCEDESKKHLTTEDCAVGEHVSSTSTIDMNSAHLIFLGTGCATPSPHRSSSGIGLFMPTSNYRKENDSHTNALALSAIIECGEGTLSSLSRYIQSFSPGFSSLDDQLSEVKFIWVSHAHLDHYGDLSSVVQAVANAKRKAHIPRPVVVIAPPKVLKYLRVMLNSQAQGQDRQYVGITQRDFQTSPFAGHVRSMIYDGVLAMPSSSQLDEGRQSTYYYKPFVSIQNIEVNHCRDAYALLLELCIATKNGALDRFSLCFSGDTRPCLMHPSSMQRMLHPQHSPISLLIHEATFLDDHHGREDALRKKHSTVREALDVATSIKAESCMLTHFSQRYSHVSASDVSPVDTREIISYPGNWGIACDGMMIPLTKRGMASLLPLTKCIDAILCNCTKE